MRYGEKPLGGRVGRIERDEHPTEKVRPFDGFVPTADLFQTEDMVGTRDDRDLRDFFLKGASRS